MISSSSLRLLALCALAVTLPSTVWGEDPVTLVGNSGKVNIGEIETENLRGPYVAYFVDVLDPTVEVAAFAVSSGIPEFSRHPQAQTSFPDWFAQEFSLTEWDSGFEFSIGGTTTVTTNSLGSASSLFGNDPWIALFLLGTGNNTIFDHGDSANDQDPEAWELGMEQFHMESSNRSEFIALDINGQVIDFSIPEPGTLAMGALISVGLLARRKH